MSDREIKLDTTPGPERTAQESEPQADAALQPRQDNGGRPSPRRQPRRLAGSFLTGIIVLVAVGVGVAIGMSFVPHGEAAGDASPGEAAGVATVWTCSMHPQIRQPNPGKCPICGMDLIPAGDGGGEEATGLREVSISREARALLDVQVTPVERRYVTATVRMVGKVEQDETRLAYVTARFPGRLDRLFVDYSGVMVHKGDHMVSIYSPDLYSAQAELIRARQSAQQRRSSTAVLSAERLLESAREKLRLWGLTEEQVRAIEQSDEPSDHLTIYAPISGIVHTKHAQEGMYVDTGTRIFTLIDLSEVWVQLDAYESDLAWLRYGQQVEFTTEAYPGEVFTGRIAFINHMLNPATRTVKVRVNVPNPRMKLKPEMFVRAEVRAQVSTAGRVMDPALAGKWICRMHPSVVRDTAGDCPICGMPLVRTESLGYLSASADATTEPLVVPASAVLKTGTRAVVYVERPDAEKPTYEGREIVLGPRAGDFYIVRSGLEEGERVVTQGTFKLDSALQIAAKPSMMNPQVAVVGGGHSHGESAVGAAHEEGGGDHMHVPPSVALHLARVQAAAAEVAAASRADDREAIRETLRRFEEALAAVDASALQGLAAMAWKELAMQLRNDAVQGRWAADRELMGRAVDQLMADIGRLRHQFGLPEDPDAMLASAALDVPPAFREQLGPLWRSYGAAHDALVNDDPNAARAAAAAAEEALAGVDAEALAGEAADAWSSAREAMIDTLGKMTKATQLAALRAAFAAWTDALAPLVTAVGLAEPAEPIYRHSCSMALENKGATWLQTGELVRNPYMGQKMPRCSTGVEVAWHGPPELPSAPASPTNIPDSFRNQLGGLWGAYLKTQEALAADDLAAARGAATALDETLRALDRSTLSGATREAWERERANLRTAVDRMIGAEGLEPLRAGFALLSEEMPVLFEMYRPEVDGAVYRMHCPMAFDGRGAVWLQASDEVRNPYFGAGMIRCATEVERIAGPGRPAEEGRNDD